MTKTPEQMAEEWALGRWYADHDPTVSDESKVAFLAGYQAAKDQLADADKVMNSPNNSNGWISVNERLPESWVHVLIYQFPTIWVSGYCHEQKRWGYYESGEPCHPTHWMPLPKPPEDK